VNIHRYLAAIGAVCLPTVALAQANPPDPRPGPATPVQVMNGPNNPVPVDGLISGEVEIINTEPLKVMVVSPSNPNQTVCELRGVSSATSSTGGFAASITQQSSLGSSLSCPTGVKGVLVRRAVLALYRGQGTGPENVQNVIGVFGFSKEEGSGFQDLADMNLIAGLSFSVPEKSLDTPIPVTPSRAFTQNLTCAGIPSYPVRCTTGLLLIGDPIPN
jgi:hypothetical protein